MIFWAYNLLIVFLSPLWVPWMVWRAKKRKEQPDWRQRCGDLPLEAPAKGVRRVWVHAVSVGEVMAAVPVLQEIRRLDPGLEIVLSTTTSSGQTAARERALNLFDHLVYFPIDVPRFVVAALMRVRPKAVAIMETELWLNFLWASKQFGVQTIVLNGRLSDRSYSRARPLKPYYRALFKNLDQVLAQTQTYAKRFADLGFARAQVVGNTKFDAALAEAAPKSDWRAELGIPVGDKVVVVGSTRSPGEEQIIAAALASLRSLDGVSVVHAPRHIERAQGLADLYLAQLGIQPAFRSKGEKGKVTVLDTYGELGGVYSIADVAVIGGSFEDFGGQNLIQPLAHGVPVLHGPYMQNFRDVAEAAAQSGASQTCADSADLTLAIQSLLEDLVERNRRSTAAKALVHANIGAARRCAEAIVAATKG